MLFVLGLFLGGILGMFLTSVLTIGKFSDCERYKGDDDNV